MSARRSILILLLTVCAALPALAQETSPRSLMDFYRLAAGAERNEEFAAARDHYAAGLAAVPGSPHMMLGVARTSAALGDTAGCLAALQQLAAVGGTYDLSAAPALAALAQVPGFPEVSTHLEDNGKPQKAAEVAFTLKEAEMWTEGIACDLVTGDVFAGSVMLTKLIRLRPGWEEEFGTSAQDGLMEILGLDIDEERRELWAVTGRDEAEAHAKHDFGEAPRDNAIVVYDLKSGMKHREYVMAKDDRIHLWNDVAVAPDGTAYFTDMTTSEIYRIPPGGDVELFHTGVDYQNFNGIVISDDGSLIYAAALEGVVVLPAEGGGPALLACPNDLYTGLGDGMALRGRDLYVVQNSGLLNERILHCRLDETGRKVESWNALPCGLPEGLMPYTCALGKDVLYVNGTAPFASYDVPDSPPNPVVVAVPLK